VDKNIKIVTAKHLYMHDISKSRNTYNSNAEKIGNTDYNLLPVLDQLNNTNFKLQKIPIIQYIINIDNLNLYSIYFT
jgi:hypothetical protein